MKKKQLVYRDGWQSIFEQSVTGENSLGFVFFDRQQLESSPNIIKELKYKYPSTSFVVCSGSGSIDNNSIVKDDPVATILEFEKSNFKIDTFRISDYSNGTEIGNSIFASLNQDDLKHIMLFTEGNTINGTDIVEGINNQLKEGNKISISGGLAGDNDRFEKTLVGIDENYSDGQIIAIGFYGENLRIETSSQGGWQAFGPTMIVTKSNKNVLYQIDNQSALDLYKRYLGVYADQLPGAALLFPLEIQRKGEETKLVRTILSIDEESHSMVFAGDIPEGAQVRMMRAKKDDIICSASQAMEETEVNNPDAVLLISCVGRRLILAERAEEEIEEVRETIGDEPLLFGFYSYGELSMEGQATCELYNQTMTITTINES